MSGANRIIVAGYSGTNDFALARYNGNGSLDATFGIGGKVTNVGYGKIFSMAIDGLGRIVVSGDGGSISSWSITIFGITPVPEPTSILLGAAAFGLVGSAIRRRWNAKRA